MTKVISHKHRAMLVLCFIVIPGFLLSAWIMIQIEFYDYVVKSKKTYLVYSNIVFFPLVGAFCYFAHRRERINKIRLHEHSIDFGPPDNVFRIFIDKVEYATLDAEQDSIKF